jgi:hypothetical protein
MWFDLLHICLSIENVLKQNFSCFYSKSSDFLNQWIKLLLSWSFLCNDCLKTMTWLYIHIYLFLVLIQSAKTYFFEKFLVCCPIPDRESWLDKVWLSQTMFGLLGQCLVHAQIQGYLNPRLLPPSALLRESHRQMSQRLPRLRSTSARCARLWVLRPPSPSSIHLFLL